MLLLNWFVYFLCFSFDVDFECLYEVPDAISNLEPLKQAQSFLRLAEEVVTDFTAYLKKLRPFFCS